MWLLSIAQVLTVLATGAQAEVAAGPASANLPDPISTRQTYFAIPFEIDQVDHPVLGATEIQLYVSQDRGVTWLHETSVTPTTKYFLFRAPGDGEYWFAVRTKDRAGSLRPRLVTGPGLRVVVDTQAPGLAVEAQRGSAGQIIAKWKIDEANVKPETLKLQYRVGDAQQWETVAIDPASVRDDGAGNVGEVTWWAPAGQGRIEIRAEVADAAGNRNVSHAQVTTVASAMPATDVMAQAPQNNIPPTVAQDDWQASSGQNTWPQPNQSAASQTSPPLSPSRDPYPQSYGSGANSMAGQATPNSNYSPAANPSYPNSVSGNDQNHSGASVRGYGADPNMTARNPQSSRSEASPSTEQAQPDPYGQYGQYAQNQQTQTQTQQPAQYNSQSGYGSSNRPQADSTWPQSPSPAANDYAMGGSLAAQSSPAYQSQYNPGATASQKSESSPNGSYGRPGGNNAGNGSAERTVNNRLFEIEYANPPQPMAVGRVELWGTRDDGRSWQSFGFDSDSRSPMLARVPDEGTYGFRVVFHPIHGQAAQAPRPGQSPDMRIRVDLTQPNASIVDVNQSPRSPDELTIRWQASDSQLAQSPISLYFADAATGQWRPIAQNLKNSGDYRWKMPSNLPAQVQIRVEVHDVAGNIATAETRNPIRLAQTSRPQIGSSQGSVEIRDVRPLGQPGQTTPRRYQMY